MKKKVQGFKMYDGMIAYIRTENIKLNHVQRVEWRPESRRWEALFFMKDGSVVIREVVARVGEDKNEST